MQEKKRERKMGSRAFRYFAICYGVLLCFMVVFISGIYISTRQALTANAQRITQLELDNCGVELDIMLATADEAAVRMSRSTELKKLANGAYVQNGQDAYDMYSAVQEFSNVKPLSGQYDGAYLYYPSSGRVITGSAVYQYAEQFFDQCIKEGEYSQWKQLMKSVGRGELIYGDGKRLNVLNGVSFVYPGSKQAVSCFYINRARVDAAMHSDYEGSGYCILNADGAVVMSNMSEESQTRIADAVGQDHSGEPLIMWLDDQDMMLSVRKAQSGNASYVMAVPLGSVYEQMNGVERMILALVICLVSASVLIGMALSWKNTLLIRGFVSTLSIDGNTPSGMQEPVRDEFSAIEEGIHSLIHENINYQNMLVQQRASLRTVFFFRLFAGEYVTDSDMFAAMNEAGLAVSGSAFAAARICCPGGAVDAQLLTAAAYDDCVYISPVSEGTYSALLVLSEATPEAVRATADRLLPRLPDSALIVLGTPCTELSAVAESYAMARLTHEHMTPGQYGIVECRRAGGGGLRRVYTYETEGKLLTLVRTGCVSEVRAMLRELCEKVEPDEMIGLIRCLNTTRMRSAYELRMNDDFVLPDVRKDSMQAMEAVSDALIAIAENRREREAGRASQLEVSIRKYIMENYLDPTLSLTAIAGAMKLSEPYLSAFFKQKTGENISIYIERLRVERAYRLLTETDMPIGEVAQKSGYQSDQTFRRAFKKLMGCVPGQVRQ